MRLDRQKEKYAHMFDVKTPTRTYYLAADTEEDMRGWVNCICHVCQLQETQTNEESRPYYNISAINTGEAMNMATAVPGHNDQLQQPQDHSNDTEVSFLNHSSLGEVHEVQPQPRQSLMSGYNPYGTYQNEEMLNFRASEYSNRETIISDSKLSHNYSAIRSNVEAYSNLGTIERSQSLRGKPSSPEKATSAPIPVGNHMRTQSLNTDQKTIASVVANSVKKIPENLKLSDRIAAGGFESGTEQPSPALSTSSGPYIPIHECFSGSPMLHSPITPLNSLDPRFYDTPRSHPSSGFNLISTEQPYSPKRSNVSGPPQQSNTSCSKTSRSGKSSPSDSESVFTDDESAAPAPTDTPRTKDRNTRPSDSSIENDAIGWTYVQRFARVSQDDQSKTAGLPAATAPPRPPKRTSLILDSIEK